VALLLRPHRRARAPRPQHLRRARQPVDARQYCPDELLRPPRSQPVPNVYADANAGADTGAQPQFPKATGPISYIGQKAVAQDIANLKAGLAAAGYDERDGYINAL